MGVFGRLQGRVAEAPTAAAVVAIAAATAMLRLPFLGRQMYPDEGGLLLVARSWSGAGPELYGPLFLDRPPLLIAVFWVADAAGGLLALRLIGVVLATAAVLLSGWAGWLIAGRRGALTAAMTAAALLTNPMLGGHEVNAELVGLPLVLAAVALGLSWLRQPHRWRPVLAAAGLAAGLAPLVKQNLWGGLVFLVVLLATAERSSRRVAWGRLGWVLGWFLVPVAAAAGAAATGPGLTALWDAVVGFRLSASELLATASSPATDQRAWLLLAAAAVSGLVLLGAVALWGLRAARREPAVLAASVMLLVDVGAIVLGGSYWHHYLLVTVPGLSLLAARACLFAPRLMPAVVAAVVSSALVASGISASAVVTERWGRTGTLADWLAAAKQPGDTGVVAYGQPQILRLSGLRPAYRYIWSLPLRVLDPELRHLARRLRAESGPAWVVVVTPLDTWSLDADGRAGRALEENYRQVAVVCGWPVHLRADLSRPLPPEPTDC